MYIKRANHVLVSITIKYIVKNAFKADFGFSKKVTFLQSHNGTREQKTFMSNSRKCTYADYKKKKCMHHTAMCCSEFVLIIVVAQGAQILRHSSLEIITFRLAALLEWSILLSHIYTK